MKRTHKLSPDAPPLQGAGVSAGPTALEIASAEIERLQAEIERLSNLSAPDLKVETALYEALRFERQANKALRQQIHNDDLRYQRFRANRLAHAVGKNLKPGQHE